MAIRSVDRRSVYPTGNALRRALLTLRGEGARSFWFKLLAQIGYRRLLLLDRPLADAVPEFSPTLPVEIAELTKGELDEYLFSARYRACGHNRSSGHGSNLFCRALRPANRRGKLDRDATDQAVLP